MIRAAVLLAFGLVLFARPALHARQDDAQTKVDFRVTTSAPGRVVIDRGTADGLRRGDRVTLRPKEGGSYLGVITEPLERIATVELDQRAATLETGTRGDTMVSKDRFKKKKTTSPPKDAPKDAAKDPAKDPVKDPAKSAAKDPAKDPAKSGDPAKGAGAMKSNGPNGNGKNGEAAKPANGGKPADPAAPKNGATKSTKTPKDGAATQSTPKNGDPAKTKPVAKPGGARVKSGAQDGSDPLDWKNKDQDFKSDMALLSDVGSLKPEERQPAFRGTVWAAAGFGRSQLAKDSNNYFRAGAEFDADNLLEQGGSLHFDAEIDYRTKWLGHTSPDLLLRGLSYTVGDNRFSSERVEVGRFLQHIMPEFGYLDGVEWTHRTNGGDRVGASFGFMPENDDDFSSFDDLQIGVYYDWRADDSERFVLTGAYQQTWHDSDRDRNLLIGRMLLQSGDGWDFRGTAWVDYYNEDDKAKSTGLEVTQAVASLTRTFDDGDGFSFAYDQRRFPELERYGEYIPLSTDDELKDNKNSRLSISGWTYLDNTTRFHAIGGAWTDEDESGSFVEGGIDFPNVLMEDARLDVTGFVTKGQFESVVGGRTSYGVTLDNGRFDVFYEYGGHKADGFSQAVGEFEQHRGYVSRTFYFADNWLLTLQGGVSVSDSEVSWDAGFFVRKTF